MEKPILLYRKFIFISEFTNSSQLKSPTIEKESINIKNKNLHFLFLLNLLFSLFVIGTGTSIAQPNVLSDTNYITAHDADSIIVAIELKLDKSGYGFYNMVCKDGYTLNYRLLKPATIPGLKYPLVFTLPASGVAGSDNYKQLGGVGPTIWGQPAYQSLHPHYSVVPQQSALITDTTSNYKNICAFEFKELRDTLIRLYPDIDTSRIYVTGHSAGGSFVYRMLGLFPNSFAAGIANDGAIGGAHEGYAAMAVWPAIYVEKNTAVWMFNGGLNDAVKPNQINGMFHIADSITAHGGNPVTTYMPNLNHAETEGMYKLQNGLFDWLFSQHRVYNSINNFEENQKSIIIYPNPAANMIFITGLRDNKITIYNTTGTKVLVKDGIRQGIDISSLPHGVYILKSDHSILKFIKL